MKTKIALFIVALLICVVLFFMLVISIANYDNYPYYDSLDNANYDYDVVKESLWLNIDDISYILVRNGTTGENIVVNDKSDIHDVVYSFNSLNLIKERSIAPIGAKPPVGWTIILEVYGICALESSKTYVLSETGIGYDGYWYTNQESIAYFHGRFKDMFN